MNIIDQSQMLMKQKVPLELNEGSLHFLKSELKNQSSKNIAIQTLKNQVALNNLS